MERSSARVAATTNRPLAHTRRARNRPGCSRRARRGFLATEEDTPELWECLRLREEVGKGDYRRRARGHGYQARDLVVVCAQGSLGACWHRFMVITKYTQVYGIKLCLCELGRGEIHEGE